MSLDTYRTSRPWNSAPPQLRRPARGRARGAARSRPRPGAAGRAGQEGGRVNIITKGTRRNLVHSDLARREQSTDLPVRGPGDLRVEGGGKVPAFRKKNTDFNDHETTTDHGRRARHDSRLDQAGWCPITICRRRRRGLRPRLRTLVTGRAGRGVRLPLRRSSAPLRRRRTAPRGPRMSRFPFAPARVRWTRRLPTMLSSSFQRSIHFRWSFGDPSGAPALPPSGSCADQTPACGRTSAPRCQASKTAVARATARSQCRPSGWSAPPATRHRPDGAGCGSSGAAPSKAGRRPS